MRVSIVPKAELSKEQVRQIEKRRLAPKHSHDKGPVQVWSTYNNGTLYAVIDDATDTPIGIAEASGEYDAANVGWWVDKRFRRRGYGNALVDALAEYLKAKGYRGVGVIKICTFRNDYDIPSQKLKKRFIAHFRC